VRREFYVQHHKPKRLFARELCKNARRSLQADKLKPSCAMVEARTHPRSTQSAAEIRSLVGHLKTIPDYRKRIGIYPLWSLLALAVLAHLCGAPRGQKDLAKFAKGMNQGQRHALGVRRQRDGYPAPSQPTFCRMMKHVDDEKLEAVFLQVQRQIRGAAPPEELIVLDGKQPRQGGGQSVLTAVSVPASIIWAAPSSTPRPTKYRSHGNCSINSTWTGAKSAWMPSILRTKPPASLFWNMARTFCSRSKATSPPSKPISKSSSPPRRSLFFPEDTTPTLAGTRELIRKNLRRARSTPKRRRLNK